MCRVREQVDGLQFTVYCLPFGSVPYAPQGIQHSIILGTHSWIRPGGYRGWIQDNPQYHIDTVQHYAKDAERRMINDDEKDEKAMEKLSWSRNSERYDLEKLAESIYDEEGGFAKINSKHTDGLGKIEYPEYLGFYQGITLHIHTSFVDSKKIWFSGGAKWGESECLKKFLVLFYMDRKLYPSFENFEGHLIMTLEEI